MDLLVDYMSDSEEEPPPEKTVQTSQRLPLPGVLLNKVKTDVNDEVDKNDGRIRSFPHERGNWASLVYVPCEDPMEMESLAELLIAGCYDCDTAVKVIEEPHISLTRTFVLLHHWINDFVSTVKTSVSSLAGFRIAFGGLEVYVNDEGTRSFVALKVSSGSKHLTEAVSLLDSCLSQYRLRPFYQEGSFHMSLCWCLGDRRSYFESVLSRLTAIVDQFLVDYPSAAVVSISQLNAKIGNRLYTFDLFS